MKAMWHLLKSAKPNTRQLREYGAVPKVKTVSFSSNRGGYPPPGHEKVIFCLEETSALMRLELFLKMGRHSTRPNVVIEWISGGKSPAKVERVYEKIMLVSHRDEIVFSCAPKPIG
jgi:hypothetical protein